MVAFELGAGGRGLPDSVSKRTSSKWKITSEFDPYATFGLEQVLQSLPSDPVLTSPTAMHRCAMFRGEWCGPATLGANLMKRLHGDGQHGGSTEFL